LDEEGGFAQWDNGRESNSPQGWKKPARKRAEMAAWEAEERGEERERERAEETLPVPEDVRSIASASPVLPLFVPGHGSSASSKNERVRAWLRPSRI